LAFVRKKSDRLQAFQLVVQHTHSKFDVAVVGELNLDIILSGLPHTLQLDREHLASGLKITLGSSSAIFAHNLALLGNKVSFSSTIGDDAFGELCLQRLGESGTDLSGVVRHATQQTGLTVILAQDVQRYILTYPGTMSAMRYEDLNLEYVCHAKHFHLSSYFLQRALRSKMVELFQHVKQRGLTTSLDTNDDPEEQWSEDIFPLLAYVDVLLPNEREACKLSRAQTVEAAAKSLSDAVPLVVIKRGSEGALARRGSELFSAPPLASAFVDAVGAGDSFDAGFIHQYIRGAKIEDCLKFGNIAGALSVTRAGGTEAFRDKSHRERFLSLHRPKYAVPPTTDPS
jgi:sugar/nucleoside kinase (ribokinase family)